MLLAGQRRRAPGVEDVLLFPDDRLAGGFYAVSTMPRLARRPDGGPELALTVYGSRTAGAVAVRGGVLVLTTELSVDHQDLDDLRRRLAAELEDTWPADRRDPPPAPQLLSPEWLEARVVVRLTPDLDVTGSPSMFGDNRCSFNRKLDAQEAKALSAAWEDGLPEAVITYSGRLRSAATDRGTTTRAADVDSSASVTSSRTSWSTSRASSATTVTTTTSGRWASDDPDAEGDTRSWSSETSSYQQDDADVGVPLRSEDADTPTEGVPRTTRLPTDAVSGAGDQPERIEVAAPLTGSVPALDGLRHVVEM